MSDFDLTVSNDVAALREMLDSLKESAHLQEDDPFDPSGTANEPPFTEIEEALSEAEISGHGDLQSPINPNIAYSIAADGSLELTGASADDKVALLAAMFPTVSSLDIQQCLKKNEDDVDKSMDVLLNLSFFNEALVSGDESDILVPKGIDGFCAGNADIGRQKGRNKKRNKNQKLNLEQSPSSQGAPTINKWESGKTDLDFICSHIPDIPRGKISAVYNSKGMSLRATIRELALNGQSENTDIDKDPATMEHVAELAAAYPTISKPTLVGLLRMTGTKMTPAKELAAVLLRQPSQTEISELIKFAPAPLAIHEDEENEMPGPSYDPLGNSHRNIDYEDLQATASASFAASSAAHMQAAQAARRSRSNHLYGGASAYYRQIGQEHRERAMNQLAAASDQLVDRQSSNCDLDLHGVTVENAKRIARDRVAAWWDSLGDTKYVRGGGIDAHGGYKIITGIGRHSRDGTSRLGPAVGKMLISEGWRVSITPGSLIVLGVARR